MKANMIVDIKYLPEIERRADNITQMIPPVALK